MTGRRSLHTRTALVVTVAVAVVAGTTTFATAHHGSDKSVLHACVVQSDGQLRLLKDETSSCRANETAVQWSTGSDSGPLREFAAVLKRVDTDGGANDGDGLVDWSNLDGVSESVMTAGARIDSLAVADRGDLLHWSNLFAVPEILADGSVGFDELLGQASSAQLAVNSVLGGTVRDGSITAADLAGRDATDPSLVVAGAVTSEKIFDGTIEARDLHARSVTADKLALGSATFTALDWATLRSIAGPYQEVPNSTSMLSLDRPARIALSGQMQLTCICTDAADIATVEYQLVRVSDPGSTTPAVTVVSPVYTVQLRPTQSTWPVSLSMLDTAAAGDHAYRIRYVVTETTPTSATSASHVVVNAHAVGAA